MLLSCIVPARNEQGHLAEVISHILSINSISDIIIVEGGSIDDTYNEAIKIARQHPNKVQVVKQTGRGKFNAVQLGASCAKQDFLIIWDADGTVPLNCTVKVINHALITGRITVGNRLAGNMEKKSMQFFNLIGNWIFACMWAPMLKSKPSDMLCGTKIISTKIFESIPSFLLKLDPYGDFALIATARAHGKVIDFVPVNYQKRRYGETNIRRWSGGFRLLLTTIIAYIWFVVYRIKHE
jgi:glycosyltransferase involved in cell wall biosynthesis